MILALLACSEDGALDERDWHTRVPELAAPAETGRTVLWFTMDTLNEDYIGADKAYDSSPAHDLLFSEAVVFENTVVTRGVTVVSLPSIATGSYPRHHGVQSHELPSNMPPMVSDLLAIEGWKTFAYSANKCHLFDDSWTNTTCTDPDIWDEPGSDDLRDGALVDAFLDELDELDEDDNAFFWIHFRDPHADYTQREPWMSEFYDGDYSEDRPVSSTRVSNYTLGEPIPDGFIEWLRAVYASQVRSDDELFATIREALEDADRWDVVMTGTDHGEELGAHDDYFMHGCSPYDPVMNTTFSIRAPGFEPGLIDTHVSTVDMLPTLLELLNVRGHDRIDGRSLIPMMEGDRPEPVDVFFERGPDTAGVVRGQRKYFFFPEEDYTECKPFQDEPGTSWAGPSEGLFDLEVDPDERFNLLKSEPDPPEKRIVCEWVTSEVWLGVAQDEASSLVQACRGYLGL